MSAAAANGAKNVSGMSAHWLVREADERRHPADLIGRRNSGPHARFWIFVDVGVGELQHGLVFAGVADRCSVLATAAETGLLRIEHPDLLEAAQEPLQRAVRIERNPQAAVFEVIVGRI